MNILLCLSSHASAQNLVFLNLGLICLAFHDHPTKKLVIYAIWRNVRYPNHWQAVMRPTFLKAHKLFNGAVTDRDLGADASSRSAGSEVERITDGNMNKISVHSSPMVNISYTELPCEKRSPNGSNRKSRDSEHDDGLIEYARKVRVGFGMTWIFKSFIWQCWGQS